MANRRMITSDIWEDDFFSSLDCFERLLWIGLLTSCADDQGRIQDHPSLIRSRVFPMDDISTNKIADALCKFETSGKIVRYKSTDGKSLVQILNWWKHQSGNWAAHSNYPPPDGWHDRERYHAKGNKIVELGWAGSGGYIDGYIDDHIDTGTPILCRRDDEDDVNGVGDVNGEEEVDDDMASIPAGEPKLSDADRDFLTQAVKIFEPKKFRYKKPLIDLLELRQQYGAVRVLEILTWCAGKELLPGESVSRVRTLAPKWGHGPPGGNGTKPSVEQVFADLRKESGSG